MERRSTSWSAVSRMKAPTGVMATAAAPIGRITRRSAWPNAFGSSCMETNSSISSITGTPMRGPHSTE
jgi:hypothetical protein